MQILLCAATEFEIDPAIELIQNQKLKNVRVVITGVGLMTATYKITREIYTEKPNLVIQAGVAGGFNKNLQLTQVVMVKNETIGDLGVEENENFLSLFDMKLNDENTFPWTDGWLRNDSDILHEVQLPMVKSVSINEISTNKKRIEHYKKKLAADIESMEGAALHYVCLIEKIPFMQIRSLSNFVGERDKSKWRMKEAIANLNKELETLLTKFTRS